MALNHKEVVVKRSVIWASVVGVALISTFALARGDWSDADRKYESFKRDQQDLKTLTPKETRRLVTAICEVDEEDRNPPRRTSAIESRLRSPASSTSSIAPKTRR